jgi:RES domain-containing protein
VPYSKIINGAFSYPGNKGGRFNTNTWGAWYAGKSLKTALAEVTFHRSVLLTETAAIDDEIEYVDFLADIRGSQFADLRDGSRKSRRCLDPASHVQGQTLAHELLADKLAGLCIRRFVIPAASALRCYVRRWSAMCARGLAIGLCGQTVRQCA